jgi:hypothetical protein
MLNSKNKLTPKCGTLDAMMARYKKKDESTTKVADPDPDPHYSDPHQNEKQDPVRLKVKSMRTVIEAQNGAMEVRPWTVTMEAWRPEE